MVCMRICHSLKLAQEVKLITSYLSIMALQLKIHQLYCSCKLLFIPFISSISTVFNDSKFGATKYAFTVTEHGDMQLQVTDKYTVPPSH